MSYSPQKAKGNTSYTGIAKDAGPYLAEVMNNNDSQLSGRIQVYIPDFGGDPREPSNWTMCRYMTPFYGIQPLSNTVAAETSDLIESYGMWMQPPDVGVKVLVMFINGDRSRGVWIGCLPEIGSHGSIPANDRGDFDYYEDPNTPIAERERPQHSKAWQFVEQGLNNDPQRGPITSSSLRESPSRVFGFNTPGGNSLVMDDGNLSGGSRHIRIRSSSGNQITMNDDDGFIYIINADGSSWMELSASGHLDIYAKSGVNIATNGSINMHAQNDINMHAENNVNIQSGNATRIQGTQSVNLWGQSISLTSPESLDIHCCSDIKIRSFANINMKAGQHILRGDKFLWNTGSVAEPEQMFKTESVSTGGYNTTVKRTPTIEPFAGHDPASQPVDETHESNPTVQPPQSYKNDEVESTVPGSAGGGGGVTYFEGPPGESFEDQTRNKTIQPKLMNVLRTAASQVGVDVVIFSGGQDPIGTPNGRRTGSTRHDDGYAADVWIYNGGSNPISTTTQNETVQNFISACVAAGARGIGAGPGYMNNVGIHVDLWGSAKGSTIWGAGGKADNAQQWVKDAYANAKNFTATATNATSSSGSQVKSNNTITQTQTTKTASNGNFSGFNSPVRTGNDSGVASIKQTFNNVTGDAQKLVNSINTVNVKGNIDRVDKTIINVLGNMSNEELKVVRSSVQSKNIQTIASTLNLIGDIRRITNLKQNPNLTNNAKKVINGQLQKATSQILPRANEVLPYYAGTSLSGTVIQDPIAAILNLSSTLDAVKNISSPSAVSGSGPTGPLFDTVNAGSPAAGGSRGQKLGGFVKILLNQNRSQFSDPFSDIFGGSLTQGFGNSLLNTTFLADTVAEGTRALALSALTDIVGLGPISGIVPGLGDVFGPAFGCETCNAPGSSSHSGVQGLSGDQQGGVSGLGNTTENLSSKDNPPNKETDNQGNVKPSNSNPNEEAQYGAPPNYVTKGDLIGDPLWKKQMDLMKEKYGPRFDEEQIYKTIQGESSWNTRACNRLTRATGFFQFMPSTAKWLGTTTGAIQNMSPVEQLKLYDYYLSKFNYKGGRLGIMQAAPSYVSKPENFEVYKVGSKAWQQNSVWRGSDGRITVGSINDYYDKQKV